MARPFERGLDKTAMLLLLSALKPVLWSSTTSAERLNGRRNLPARKTGLI